MSKSTATIVLPNSDKAGGKPHTMTAHLIARDTNQISFIGILNGAPTLVSIYPNEEIMIYSTHGSWPHAYALAGAMAKTFYAKCKFNSG